MQSSPPSSPAPEEDRASFDAGSPSDELQVTLKRHTGGAALTHAEAVHPAHEPRVVPRALPPRAAQAGFVCLALALVALASGFGGMHWGAYSVCSVISGVMLVAAAWAWPELPDGTRLKIVAGGVGLSGWGLFAASQSSGLFLFSPIIFVIPVGAVVALIVGARDRAARAAVPRLNTLGAAGRSCLKCGQRYPSNVPGPCPACRGTLVADPGTSASNPVL